MRLPLLALVLAWPAFAGTPQDAGFSETTYATGLSEPVQMAWAPDGAGRLFVTEKSAGVRVIENGVLLATPFATFPQLYTQSECGVLGLCFDNAYATNKYVYVFVTVSASEQRIVRFTDVNNVGTARTTILGGLPTEGINHDGGALGMGPDGKLYFAIGDNGVKKGVDGDLATLAAKVGRCNADGSVPNDNPFADGAGPINDFIWATGFRNPFTLTFQPATGKLWLNVVGSTPDGQTEPHSTAGYEQVFVIHGGDDGGYDDYEGNQPAGSRYTTPFVRPLIRPKIQYKTDYFGEPGQTRALAGGQRAAGSVTFSTTTAHPYRVGQAIVITGAGALDGTYAVNATAGTTFTAPAAGGNASVSGGSASPLVQGGAIAGGAFYDSTAFPAEYRGNLFYADYNAGRIMRAALDAQNQVESIQLFLDDASSPTDVAIGPDGALYYLELGSGEVHRVAFDTVPGLVVSPTALQLKEGATGQFTVRLGAPPAADVLVQVHKTGASGDLDVTGGAALTFTPANYEIPQAVTITAAEDADTLDDTATFTVTAPGLDSVEVSAMATDENLGDLTLSASALNVTEGQKADLLVSLATAPAGNVKVRVRPTAGPAAKVVVKKGALLLFNATNFSTPQIVRFKAVPDANTKNEQVTFAITGKGQRTRSVTVVSQDDDPSAPVFTSTAKTTAVVGLLYSYPAAATGLPAPAFSLTTLPAGMSIDADTGLLTWTPAATGDFAVTIHAANAVGSADQSFTLTVSDDTPPVAFIIEPREGDTVSGTNAEFFGGSVDDYGTVQAEFFIDGNLVDTDTNRDAHYHLHGAHGLFDTSTLTNGPHTLQMKVTDDKQQTDTATVQVTVAN